MLIEHLVKLEPVLAGQLFFILLSWLHSYYYCSISFFYTNMVNPKLLIFTC